MNTGVGCRFLLQGIFPTQGLNPRLLYWQTNSLPLSHLGSPCCSESTPRGKDPCGSDPPSLWLEQQEEGEVPGCPKEPGTMLRALHLLANQSCRQGLTCPPSHIRKLGRVVK